MRRLLAALVLLLALTGTAHPASWRLYIDQRPVRYFVPPGYDYRTGVVVIYLHGYRTTVDRTWREQRLPEQFEHSELNAYFMVPETRNGPDQPVLGLQGLDHLIERGDRVILVAHSGGYRQAATWLSDPRVKGVVLLDAAYGCGARFRAWQEAGGLLIAVSNGTARYARAWLPHAILQDTRDSHLAIAGGDVWLPWSLLQMRALGIANHVDWAKVYRPR